MSIKVGVRVRPFNKREEQLGCKCCVEMQEKTTRIIHRDTNDKKTFVFDYSFWSHDKFIIDEEGIYKPIDEKYADQKTVYNEIGTEILTNAWEGYNCCLFAYGQTGSGKSYSMLGYGANKGIIPMVCDNIFDRIKKDNDKKHSYEVKVSMMEIYNESLRDLLTQADKKSQELKICESKKHGVYVEGLVKHGVESYEEIERKIEEGSNNRSIAATLMNESSSRSHTIVSITFIQRIQVEMGQTSIKYSTIHLVDLAGSESVGKTGVDSKDRLREAAKINQSLSTLGRVIEILAENASKAEKQFVPYRDSKLTFILRNALGGNSRTVMICAISPADDNYEETLSTLRYANRAKKIQNKAVVNESDVDKLIRMLREENEMLKKLLKEAQLTKTSINMEIIQDVQETNNNMAELGLIETDDDLLADDMEEEKSEQNNTNVANLNKVDENEPFITNLSEDELLSGRLKYSCSKILTIGNKHGIPKPDVVLAAPGILPLHCQIKNIEGKLTIEVFDEQASDYTFVNGETIHKEKPKELKNFDRLIFGTGCIFLVKIPKGEIRQISSKEIKEFKPEDIDYAFAISEMQEHNVANGLNKVSINEEEEIRKKVLEEIQSEYDKMKLENEQKLKEKLQEQEKQYQEKIEEIENVRLEEARKLKEELEKQAKEALKLRSDKEKIEEEIVHFKELEKKLEESNVDKEALQEARQALEEKMETIKQLETNLEVIEEKEEQMKQEMIEKEKKIEEELSNKLVICNNENIWNEYKLELSKKMEKAEDLKGLLLKKERIEMQKVLIELVPMVEKFNLIAKEMKKNVESGLSIDYSYISEGEVLEMLKNNSYKNKLNISIHVLNKEERRSYFWSAQVFRNRYELAMEMFEVFIRNPQDPQLYNKETDPYWDPPSPQIIGVTFLSLEPLLYKLKYEGDLSIVKKGDKIGTVHVKIYPTDKDFENDISEETINGIRIHNPRDFIEKALYFSIEFTNLKLGKEYLYSGVKIEYSLMQSSYKNSQNESEIQPACNFNFKKNHCLSDLSEIMISHFIDKPMEIKLWGELNGLHEEEEDNLTTRDNDTDADLSNQGSFIETRSTQSITSSASVVSSPSIVKTPSPTKKSGIIVSNFDVMSKIETDFNKQKEEIKKKESVSKDERKKKKGKDKDDCSIF